MSFLRVSGRAPLCRFSGRIRKEVLFKRLLPKGCHSTTTIYERQHPADSWNQLGREIYDAGYLEDLCIRIVEALCKLGLQAFAVEPVDLGLRFISEKGWRKDHKLGSTVRSFLKMMGVTSREAINGLKARIIWDIDPAELKQMFDVVYQVFNPEISLRSIRAPLMLVVSHHLELEIFSNDEELFSELIDELGRAGVRTAGGAGGK